MVHPTTATRNFGLRAENLKVLLYQSPMNNKFNNILIVLILTYLLSGRGYSAQDIMYAQRDGRILGIQKLFDHCNSLGLYRHDFIDNLLKLDYGSFKTYLPPTKITINLQGQKSTS